MIADIDPFDLPEWLGTAEVTWTPDGAVRSGHSVAGRLSSGAAALPCDLLACDEAYPQPVATDELRLHAHQAWRHGELHLVLLDDRLTLVVPGRSFSAETVLEAVRRFAKAVGARSEQYAVLLRLGQS